MLPSFFHSSYVFTFLFFSVFLCSRISFRRLVFLHTAKCVTFSSFTNRQTSLISSLSGRILHFAAHYSRSIFRMYEGMHCLYKTSHTVYRISGIPLILFPMYCLCIFAAGIRTSTTLFIPFQTYLINSHVR
jgi:hypothetical protein